jgi:hypothetical protein
MFRALANTASDAACALHPFDLTCQLAAFTVDVGSDYLSTLFVAGSLSCITSPCCCFTSPPCHCNQLQVAYHQLITLQHINNGGRLGEDTIPEQLRDESYPLRREPQDMGETTELPSPEVQVLLAVMGAAALQLAHAALGCVRIMDTLVPRADSKLGESLLPALAATQASVGRCSIVEGC